MKPFKERQTHRYDPTWDDHVIYGLLNADISDNVTVYCAIPFGHYMGDHIVSLNEHTFFRVNVRRYRPILVSTL